MYAAPLGWFEIQNLSPETVVSWKPLIEMWKRHRDAIHAGYIHPVGARPDGLQWTGFVSAAKDGRSGTALLFRELAPSPEFVLNVSPFLPRVEKVRTLAGRGCAELHGNSLAVVVPSKLDFIWVEFSQGDQTIQ